jgi:hypothetical protein
LESLDPVKGVQWDIPGMLVWLERAVNDVAGPCCCSIVIPRCPFRLGYFIGAVGEFRILEDYHRVRVEIDSLAPFNLRFNLGHSWFALLANKPPIRGFNNVVFNCFCHKREI